MKKEDVTKFIKTVGRGLTKHSPEILTGLGIAGMCTTVVLAVKATPKAMELIKEEKVKKVEKSGKNIEGMKTEKLTPIETVKVAWKPYVPAIVTGAVSIACIIGASSVNARRNAALYSAYKLSETALAEFKEKAVEVIGEDKVKEVKQKIAEDKVEKAISENQEEMKTKVIISNDGEAWFIDPFTNQPFRSTTTKIDAAINRVNRILMLDLFVSLSELYDELGLDHTKSSDYIGWCADDGLIESDFSDAVVKDGKAYVVMDFLKRPEYGYDDKSKLYG